MIYTITLNTAIDHILEIDKFELGKVLKARKSSIHQSGKAINSSRTIESLRKNVTVLGFVGKANFNYFKKLNSKFLNVRLRSVAGESRTNFTLIDSSHRLITHVRTDSYRLNHNDYQKLANELNRIITANDIVVLSGSIPIGIKVSTYKKLISLCKLKNAKVIFDSSGDFFKYGIEALPYVIKPNLEELSEYSKKELKNESEIIIEAKKLNKKGIEFVFTSLGSKGVLITQAGQNGYWKARVELQPQIFKGEEIGSGDAMIGGIAVALADNMNLESIIRLSVACGAGNLLKTSPGACDYKTVLKLSEAVIIEYRD